MNKIFKKILLGLCLIMLSAGAAKAQVAACDPASAPNTPGSCQFGNATFPNGGPLCYVCQAVVGGPNVCVPDDTVCEGMAGGDSDSNVCRIAVCEQVTVRDPSNPTGCDYTIDPSPSPIPQCFQCNDDTAPFDNHCPNGACEPALGEDPTSCPLDCLVPGMASLPSQSTMDAACQQLGITFDGPPFNVNNSGGPCEDGNVCTTDTCNGAGGPNTTCEHTDNGCSLDVSDLCCPSGCNPPPAGQLCGNDVNCDVDCKQIACPIPTPTPTPPPPPFVGCLEGSGMHGNNGGPGCGGSSCSLDPATAANASSAFGTSALSLAALASGLMARRRKR